MNTRYLSFEDRRQIELKARALRAQAMRDGMRFVGRKIAGAFDFVAHGFHRTA